MIRSYVVTLAFVVFRAIVAGLGAFEIGTSDGRLTVASWVGWVVPLLVLEACLRWSKSRRLRRSTARAPAA